MNNIAIINSALLKLGANAIDSLDGDSIEAQIASKLYEAVKNMLLSSHAWRFAVKRQMLQPSPSASPASSDESESEAIAYILPNDFLRAISASVDNRRDIVDYEIRGGRLFSAASGRPILEYIAAVAENSFPHYFSTALISRLAADFCVPLTDSTSRMESLYRIAEAELQSARNIDSRQEPPPRLNADILLGARG